MGGRDHTEKGFSKLLCVAARVPTPPCADHGCHSSRMVLPRLTPLRGAAGLVVGGVVGSVLLRKPEENDFAGAPLKRKIQRFQSLVDRGQDPQSLPKRSEMVAALKSGEEFDVLIVGAGCTGAGAALDAATRGLKTVSCRRKGLDSRSILLPRYPPQPPLPTPTAALPARRASSGATLQTRLRAAAQS